MNENLKKQIIELGHSSPLVHCCLKFHQDGMPWEDAMMVAVITLNELYEAISKTQLETLRSIPFPFPMKPKETHEQAPQRNH